MEIHEIVDDPALQVVMDLIDDDLTPDVDQLDVRQVLLVLIDGLIDLFVHANAVPKVVGRNLRVLAHVIRTCGLDLTDIGHDERLIIALGLDEDGLDPVGRTAFSDPATSFFGRVGGVQDADDAFPFIVPAQHVTDGGFGGSTT